MTLSGEPPPRAAARRVYFLSRFTKCHHQNLLTHTKRTNTCLLWFHIWNLRASSGLWNTLCTALLTILTSVVTFTNAPSGSGAGRGAPHCRCAGDQRFDFTSVVTTATMASRSILRGPVNSSNPSQSRAPLSSSLLPLQPTPGIGRRASWSPGGTHEYLRKPARSCQYGDQTRDIRKCSSMVSKSRFRLP